jgi:hypothetical protein
MNIRPLIGIALVPAAALLAVGCARRPAQPEASAVVAPAPRVAERAPTTAPSAGYPIIVRLVGRDTEVIICSSPDGPVFSASTKSGEVLVTHVSLEELRDNHPDLYRFVHPALVARASDEDASVGAPMIFADTWGGR